MAQVQGECGSLPHLKQKVFPQPHSGSTKASPSTCVRHEAKAWIGGVEGPEGPDKSR